MIELIRKYLKRYGYKGVHASGQTARRIKYQGQHRWAHGPAYHKAGATHEGNWYDEPTSALATIPVVNEWAWS